jgi:hypothetical protein
MRSLHPSSPIDHPNNGSKSQIFNQTPGPLFFLITSVLSHPPSHSLPLPPHPDAGALATPGHALPQKQLGVPRFRRLRLYRKSIGPPHSRSEIKRSTRSLNSPTNKRRRWKNLGYLRPGASLSQRRGPRRAAPSAFPPCSLPLILSLSLSLPLSLSNPLIDSS